MSTIREQLEAELGDRYRILSDIGSGGMAWVFRAVDAKHHREVAIKVLRPELGSALGIDRFAREIEIAARLSHPHIVPLFDSGRTQEGPFGQLVFYVMPFVEGESLRDRLDRSGWLSETDAIRIAGDAAAGLAYAHGHGVIHRDIKPENLLLVGEAALIADFGIALPTGSTGSRLTATGLSVGTFAYMSPEQLTGERSIDARSDLYSLGVVLMEMVTGHASRTPYDREQRRALMGVSGSEQKRISPDLQLLIEQLLAIDPDQRPASAEDVVRSLETIRTAVARPGRRVTGKRATGRRLTIAGAVVTVVIVGGALINRALPRKPPIASHSAAPTLHTIAVLPFANLSVDVENEYFSDGLGEELIHALGRIEGLRVAPRTSAWTFKGRNVDVREVGRALGVGAVVEGSVRRSGEAMRVTARLVRASDGTSLWSGTFDQRHVTDVFAIQDSITQAITENVRAQMLSGTGSSIRTATTPFRRPNFEAHDLFLRGTYQRNRRSPDGIRRAIDLFHQSVALDSSYARARVGLAEAYAVAGFYDYLPPATAFPTARANAEAALRLDPSSGSAHATLGYTALYHDWNLPLSEREFLKAIALEPTYSVAHQWYANMLTAAGRFDEARAQWRLARDLEPLATLMAAGLGWSEYYAGRFAESIRIAEEALEVDPSYGLVHYWHGLALEAAGRHGDAIRAFRRADDLGGFGPLALAGVAHALAGAGRRDSSNAILGQLASRSTVEYIPPYELATVHAALGNRTRALELLEQAVRDRSHSIALVMVDPRLVSLADEPRLVAVRQRILR